MERLTVGLLFIACTLTAISCRDEPVGPADENQNVFGSGSIEFAFDSADTLMFEGRGIWPPVGTGVAAALNEGRDTLQIVGYRELPPSHLGESSPARFTFLAIHLVTPAGITTRSYENAIVVVGMNVATAGIDSQSFFDIMARVTIDSIDRDRLVGSFSARARRGTDGKIVTVTGGRLNVALANRLFQLQRIPSLPPIRPPLIVCNSLPSSARAIQDQLSTGFFPTPEGGVLVDGIFMMTQFHLFNPPFSTRLRVRRVVLAIVQPLVQIVSQDENGLVFRASGTFFASPDGFILIQLTCPTPIVLGFDGFTTTSEGFLLIDSADRIVATFTRI